MFFRLLIDPIVLCNINKKTDKKLNTITDKKPNTIANKLSILVIDPKN